MAASFWTSSSPRELFGDRYHRSIIDRSPTRVKHLVLSGSGNKNQSILTFIEELVKSKHRSIGISIDGNPGSGKTTFAELLKAAVCNQKLEIKAKTFRESGHEGGALDMYLSNRKKLSGCFQMWMYAHCGARSNTINMISKYWKESDVAGLLICDRSDIGNACFAFANHQIGFMNDLELEFYFRCMSSGHSIPYSSCSLNVILSTSPEAALSRIYNRGNAVEIEGYKQSKEYFWWLKIFEIVFAVRNLSLSLEERHPQILLNWEDDDNKDITLKCLNSFIQDIISCREGKDLHCLDGYCGFTLYNCDELYEDDEQQLKCWSDDQKKSFLELTNKPTIINANDIMKNGTFVDYDIKVLKQFIEIGHKKRSCVFIHYDIADNSPHLALEKFFSCKEIIKTIANCLTMQLQVGMLLKSSGSKLKNLSSIRVFKYIDICIQPPWVFFTQSKKNVEMISITLTSIKS
jgi:deoxyadenosine/deoxycytidine kinase